MVATLTDDERARLDALAKWARRVLDDNDFEGRDERRANRTSMNAEMTLLPLEKNSLRPRLDRRVAVIGKDLSDVGIGIVSNQPLEDELYFCEVVGQSGVLLIRKARERLVRGSIRDYGFMILDRYDSFQHLREM
ncbi:hypothetical protein K2X85_15290 [bacterium]|nr:hypothetical protein [bacterium]